MFLSRKRAKALLKNHFCPLKTALKFLKFYPIAIARTLDLGIPLLLSTFALVGAINRCFLIHVHVYLFLCVFLSMSICIFHVSVSSFMKILIHPCKCFFLSNRFFNHVNGSLSIIVASFCMSAFLCPCRYFFQSHFPMHQF